MPQPILRPATDLDMPLLAELNGELIEDQHHENPSDRVALAERMRGWLAAEYTATIAEIDGRPVAYLLWRPVTGGIHLRQFFVHRDERRRGVGRAVMTTAIRQLWSGLRIELDVLVGNERGREFWRSLGFGEYSLHLRRA